MSLLKIPQEICPNIPEMIGIAFCTRSHKISYILKQGCKRSEQFDHISHLDAEEDPKVREMRSSLRNMPVLLTGIALILATMILETKSHHFTKEDECPEGQPHIKKNAGKEGNEFMQVEYFREDHMADLWWVDMDKENSPACNLTDLFNSGKKENVTLVYGFLFFEHYITNLSISEEGGIQSVDSRHDWFIAPLLVDPSRIKKSTVKYVESSNALVVQWEIESDEWDRELSFQLVVFRSVRIQFAYKRIPFGSLQNFSQKFDGIKNTFGIGYEYKLKDKKLWIGSIMDIKECDELLEGSAIEFKQLLPSYEMCCSARDLDFTHPRPKEELEKTDPTTEAEENVLFPAYFWHAIVVFVIVLFILLIPLLYTLCKLCIRVPHPSHR